LLAGLILNALFGSLSAAAHSTAALVSLRFAAGIGVGGSVPVVFSHLAELLPSSSR
jgi:MFS family permease